MSVMNKLRQVLLQIPLDEVPDPLFHVDAVPKPARHVAFVRENQEFVGFSGRDKGIHQPCSVPEMHILVYHAMYNQQATFDLVYMVHN